MKKSLLALVVFGAFAGSVSAMDRDIGVSLDAGTTGVGIHLVTPVAANLNARVGFNTFSYNYKDNTRDADYSMKLKLQNFDALLDYYPTSSQFRVTGGVVYNGNKVDATINPRGGNYTFNGNTYSAATAGSLTGTMDFRNLAPYLGIGWGNAVASKGWGLTADLGVLFQGSPSSQLASTNCTAAAPICAQLASDLAAESSRLNDVSKDFRYYPVARVGATYRF